LPRPAARPQPVALAAQPRIAALAARDQREAHRLARPDVDQQVAGRARAVLRGALALFGL
jgi:hypothetical protein